MNIAFKTIAALITVFVMQSTVSATSNNNFDAIDFSLYAEFDKGDASILSGNAISFPYKNAVVGLRSTVDYEQYGKLHLQFGGAYGPIDIAMDPYKMSGYVGIKSIGYGYSYPITFDNSPWSMDFKIKKTSNKYTGYKLSGTKDGTIADDMSLNATSDFIRTGLGLNYQVNQNISLTVGAGMGKWDIGATAVGTVNTGINATEIVTLMNDPAQGDMSNLHGKDGYYFIEANLPIMDEAVTLGYRRSNITAKNKTFINGFYADMVLANF